MGKGLLQGASATLLSFALAPGCSPDIETSCFVAGTLIATPEGPRPIDSLKIGDLVWSYAPSGLVPRSVQAVLRSLARVVCRVDAGDVRIRGVTPSHPMYDAALQKYSALCDLSAQSQLLSFRDEETRMLSIDHIEVEEAPEPKFPVFNLSVEGPEHNYIADGVLVHNKSAPFDGMFAFCGNAILEHGETCDDGNRIDGDVCSNDCRAYLRYGPSEPDTCEQSPTVSLPEHCVDGVDFADPVLERAVRVAIGHPEGELLQEQTSSLLVLRAHEPITQLGGLECFTQLRYLALAAGQLDDVSPLAELCRLQSVILPNNSIANLTPMASLQSLIYVHLGNNQITDPAPLAALGPIQIVVLANNLITDASGLAGLSATALDLSYNPLSTLQPLTLTSGITDLSINGTGQSDLSALAQLNGIQVLAAQDNGITDLSFMRAWDLEAWSALQVLWLGGNLITDLSPLLELNLVGLVRVYLDRNPIDCAAQADNLLELGKRYTVHTDCL